MNRRLACQKCKGTGLIETSKCRECKGVGWFPLTKVGEVVNKDGTFTFYGFIDEEKKKREEKLIRCTVYIGMIFMLILLILSLWLLLS